MSKWQVGMGSFSVVWNVFSQNKRRKETQKLLNIQKLTARIQNTLPQKEEFEKYPFFKKFSRPEKFQTVLRIFFPRA